MKRIQTLMLEIVELTTKIESDYPELYKYLDETPVSLGHSQGKEISTIDLEAYLTKLKTLLREYIETHLTT